MKTLSEKEGLWQHRRQLLDEGYLNRHHMERQGLSRDEDNLSKRWKHK